MTLHLERDRDVAVLRLDNPTKLNALTPGMIDALEAYCEALERAEGLRGVVVAAVPPKAFCAGADIAAWGSLSPDAFARGWIRRGHRAFDRLARLSVPTVAAIAGHAFGGGLELAAACDVRIMAPGVTIALPEAQVGIVPGWGGTQRLLRLLPEPIVRDMALLGTRVPAERLLTLGFASELSDDPEVVARARIGAGSARAVAVAKAMIDAAVGEDRGAAIEALGGALMSGTEDKAEGLDAFGAKRVPVFPPRRGL